MKLGRSLAKVLRRHLSKNSRRPPLPLPCDRTDETNCHTVISKLGHNLYISPNIMQIQRKRSASLLDMVNEGEIPTGCQQVGQGPSMALPFSFFLITCCVPIFDTVLLLLYLSLYVYKPFTCSYSLKSRCKLFS